MAILATLRPEAIPRLRLLAKGIIAADAGVQTTTKPRCLCGAAEIPSGRHKNEFRLRSRA